MTKKLSIMFVPLMSDIFHLRTEFLSRYDFDEHPAPEHDLLEIGEHEFEREHETEEQEYEEQREHYVEYADLRFQVVRQWHLDQVTQVLWNCQYLPEYNLNTVGSGLIELVRL